MPPPTRNQVRDSAIRASLGALDRNNPITQWMFEDDEKDEVVERRTEMKQDLPRSTFKQRFGIRFRVVADSAVASVPRSDSTMTPKKSIRRAFGKSSERMWGTRIGSINAIELADTIQAENCAFQTIFPSRFPLAPESDDSSATTPYVLCSPVEQPEIPSGPVYPISALELRRSISLQELGSTSPSAERGREVPFPTRPVLPLPLSLAVLGDARNVRMSLDARASVLRQRYQRDTGIRHPPLNPTA
ncbi:hypothetical protein BDP27DRAFT_1342238 [Rhodocollybia butyracea]|uniref:Uncharacterized protein n=1 Tax=Rhodocollybia butyracea TaxID=206335 RepID=A0A9P5PB52_9AGAR|nr:hypothetical protein BDP27DRAFT_1342238 [Rhodocollybia butyracea]